MKIARTLASICCIVFIAVFLYSCQKEKAGTTEKVRNNKILKDETEMPDCGSTPLDDGPFYQLTYSFTRQWAELSKFEGYFRNNKYFKVQAWNDEDNFYVYINSFGYQFNQTQVGHGNEKEWVLVGPTDDDYLFTSVIITYNGIDYVYSMDDPSTPGIVETATEYTQSFPLPEGWQACDPVLYSVKLEGDGQQVWIGTPDSQEDLTYNLYGDPPCVTELTGERISCSPRYEVSFTFTSTVDLNYVRIYGPLFDYTILDIPEVSTDPSGFNSSFSDIDGILDIAGYIDLAACTPLVINVQWDIRDGVNSITGEWVAEDSQGNVLATCPGLVCN